MEPGSVLKTLRCFAFAKTSIRPDVEMRQRTGFFQSIGIRWNNDGGLLQNERVIIALKNAASSSQSIGRRPIAAQPHAC